MKIRSSRSIRSSRTRTEVANDVESLQFEKCEQRNMLSASTAIDLGAFVQQGNDQLILKHLASDSQTAYLQKGAFDLQLLEVATTEQGTVSTFQQTMDNLLVHGSFVTVTQGANGDVQGVSDRAFSHLLTQDSLKPTLDINAAMQIANQGFDSRVDISTQGDRVWFNDGDRAQLSWRIETIATGIDNGSDTQLTTVVDADTGSILTQSQGTIVADEAITNTDTGIHPRITINDAIGAAGSRDYAAPFDSVVQVNNGCTGTLVAPNVVITARHCQVGTGGIIEFGDNGASPIFTASVQSSSLPDGTGTLLDGGDVAILTLTANVPGNIATPMRFIDATNDLVGMTASLNGYGLNGLGSTGHGGTSDGWRWGGENVIDVYGTPASQSGSNIISTDFDDGTIGNNNIGGSSSTPLTFEATTAGGDSGGAVFVQQGGEWLIGGVLSGGTTGNSVYGDISWWTGTAIYRAEIEAAGGEFADPGLGSVDFDSATYTLGDTVSVVVEDSNASGPLSVTVASTSGDIETLSLTGGGTTFTGSIVTSDSGVSTGDGTLQAADGDTLTVTYIDADDGSGSSNTVTATAIIFEPADGSLVGIDFDQPGTPSPGNWNLISGGSNTAFNNLTNENGDVTAIDLAITELVDGAWLDFEAIATASTIPTSANAITEVQGQIYTGSDAIELQFQDLTPGTEYEIYVMGLDSFFPSISQSVTITGEGTPVSFDQIFNSGDLIINDSTGSSANALDTYAEFITADVNGDITINVNPISGTSDVVLAGLAIKEVPAVADPILNPIASKYRDGVVASGSLSDAFVSDDVYLQIGPSPTTNPVKQKIDLVLLAEATPGPINSFAFRLEASLIGGPAGDVVQNIFLQNNTGDWELVDTRPVDNSESVVEIAAAGDLTRFVNQANGETLARVEWASPVFSGSTFNWTVNVDQFGWVIS